VKTRPIKTILFDLDGTLLDTLDDLTASTNHALRLCGYPEKTSVEMRRFLGNGFCRLLEFALPEGSHNPDYALALSSFREHYRHNYNRKTILYPGILALLAKLQEKQKNLAIVSNKYQEAVDKLHTLYFQNYISKAYGERENLPRKPAPDALYMALQAFNSQPEESVYIGDAQVDLEAATNAGMPCIMVSWGFSSREELEKQQASTIIVDHPLEILNFLS